jgi:membrane complex biogenesis BtpA family protein
MFNRNCSLIGAVHVLPLPGAARYGGNIQKIVAAALEDVRRYEDNGMDAVILENMHDVPFLKGYVDPETVAAMTVVAQTVRRESKLPVGVQLLAGANIEALAVAVAASLDFIRVEGFVFAHVGDEGIHESGAAQLIRRRALLKAENVKIFADIKKKHAAHAITADVSLVETAHAAAFFEADGVIVTGSCTGIAPEAEEASAVRAATDVKVLIGSGVTEQNVAQFVPHSDALIVGTSLKIDGKWNNAVDAERVKKLVESVQRLEASSASLR